MTSRDPQFTLFAVKNVIYDWRDFVSISILRLPKQNKQELRAFFFVCLLVKPVHKDSLNAGPVKRKETASIVSQTLHIYIHAYRWATLRANNSFRYICIENSVTVEKSSRKTVLYYRFLFFQKRHKYKLEIQWKGNCSFEPLSPDSYIYDQSVQLKSHPWF